MLDWFESKDQPASEHMKMWLNALKGPVYNGPTRRTRCYSNRARKYHRKAIAKFKTNPSLAIHYICLYTYYAQKADIKPKFWLSNIVDNSLEYKADAPMNVTVKYNYE